jgi:hypothetical protein
LDTWQARAQSLRARIRRWGLLRTLYQIIMEQAGTRLGLYYAHVYTRPLSDSAPAPVGIRICLADYETLIPYTKKPEHDLSVRFLRSAFERGDACVATIAGERLAAYGWVAYATVPHTSDVWLEFPPAR